MEGIDENTIDELYVRFIRRCRSTIDKIYHATHLIFKNQENIDGSYIPNFSNSHIFDVL